MRVERCFGFVDLCGFTSFTEHYGDEHTVVVLATFRTTLRGIAARRGVRLAKWLGDGAMLSAADAEAVVAMVMEVSSRTDPVAVPLPIRAGLAEGAVIMFEGDDYIGRPANVASRLCDAAAPGEVLCTREVASLAPRWVAIGEPSPYEAPGFDRPIDAFRLHTAASSSPTSPGWPPVSARTAASTGFAPTPVPWPGSSVSAPLRPCRAWLWAPASSRDPPAAPYRPPCPPASGLNRGKPDRGKTRPPGPTSSAQWGRGHLHPRFRVRTMPDLSDPGPVDDLGLDRGATDPG
jgi:adenylate cyclase